MEVLPAPINPTSTIRRPRIESGSAGASRSVAVLRVMAGKASTSRIQRATPVRAIRRLRAARLDLAGLRRKELRRVRGRILLIVLAILVLAAIVGLVYVGLNPPNPVAKPIEKTLPNDKFQVH